MCVCVKIISRTLQNQLAIRDWLPRYQTVLKLRQVIVTMNGEMVKTMNQTTTGYFIVFCERFLAYYA